MADHKAADPAIVTAALAAAAMASGGDRSIAAMMIPDIVVMLTEGAAERAQVIAMLEAPVLTGKYLGFKLHDSNQRMLVTMQAEGRDPEDFWSERTDTPHGAAQLKLLQRIPYGCQVRIWKGLRQIEQHKKVRDMLHIQRVDSSTPPARDAGNTAAGSPAPSEVESPPAPSEGAPPSRLSGLELGPVLERLSGADRVTVSKWAASQDPPIRNIYGELSPADKSRILSFCELLPKE